MILSATITEGGSAFSPILFAGDLLDGMAQAADAGYVAVELHLGRISPQSVDRIRCKLTQHCLALSTICTGRSYLEEGLCFAHDDPAVRQQAVRRVRETIDAFCDLQPLKPMIVIGLLKGRLSDAFQPEVAIARIDECLRMCCEYADEHDFQILLEPANRYEYDYLFTVKEAVGVIDRVGAENLGVVADVFHMNIEERSVFAAFYQYRQHIRHVHFADSDRWYPGHGHIDFKMILETLQAIGYQGHAGVECFPRPDGRTAACRARQYLQHLLHLVDPSTEGRSEKDTEVRW